MSAEYKLKSELKYFRKKKILKSPVAKIKCGYTYFSARSTRKFFHSFQKIIFSDYVFISNCIKFMLSIFLFFIFIRFSNGFSFFILYFEKFVQRHYYYCCCYYHLEMMWTILYMHKIQYYVHCHGAFVVGDTIIVEGFS